MRHGERQRNLFRQFLEIHSLQAINTFFEAGYTWRFGHNTTAVIDYICCPATKLDFVQSCTVDADIDFSYGVREDHRLVRASISADGFSKVCSRASKSVPKVNKFKLGDPSLRESFKHKMWAFQADPFHDVDQHLGALSAHVLVSVKGIWLRPRPTSPTFQLARDVVRGQARCPDSPPAALCTRGREAQLTNMVFQNMGDVRRR